MKNYLRTTNWGATLCILSLTLLISLPASAEEQNEKRINTLPQLVDAGPAPETPLASVAEGAEPFVATTPDEFVAGDMLVKFKEHVSPDDTNVAALKKEFDAELKHSHKMIGVHLFKLKAAKTKGDTLAAIEKFKKHPLVEFAEPNGIVQAIPTTEGSASDVGAAYVPNDPYIPYQWGLNRIFAFDAWNLSRGNPNNFVAIVDTGVNWGHPDLRGKVWVPSDRRGNCISPGTWPMDDNGHGTRVAGIAAAGTDNGIGIAGVGFNTNILAIKVFNSDGFGTVDSIVCGINMAAVIPAVKAINLSWGFSGSSSTLYSAVYNAWATYGKTVVAANGNNGHIVPSPYLYPACYSLNGIAIVVGATDSANNRASYSSANNCITVSAPGSSILSTYSTNYSTANTYTYGSCTGMAAPHVSGCIALMADYSPRTPAYIRYDLSATAQDRGVPGWDIYYGYGIFNCYRALRGY